METDLTGSSPSFVSPSVPSEYTAVAPDPFRPLRFCPHPIQTWFWTHSFSARNDVDDGHVHRGETSTAVLVGTESVKYVCIPSEEGKGADRSQSTKQSIKCLSLSDLKTPKTWVLLHTVRHVRAHRWPKRNIQNSRPIGDQVKRKCSCTFSVGTSGVLWELRNHLPAAVRKEWVLTSLMTRV